MVNYVYCFEINGLNNYSIKLDDRKNFQLGEVHFRIFKAKDENLSKEIQERLKTYFKNIQIDNIFYIDFSIGKSFVYIGIEFHFNDPSKEGISYSTNRDFLQNILKIFEDMTDFINISYYLTDIPFNYMIESYIEDLIKDKIKEEKLQAQTTRNINFASPFVLKISSIYNFDFKQLIKSAIESFYDENFPNFLTNIPINVLKFTLDFLLYKEDKESLQDLCQKILINFFERINLLYSNLGIPLQHLQMNLPNIDKIIQSYDQKTLDQLEHLFRELEHKLFKYTPLFFIHELDMIFENIEQYIGKGISRVPPYSPYSEEFPRIAQNILKSYKYLKEELTSTIDKIYTLKLQKTDLINSFTKMELKERLINIKSEAEFQDILAIILKDLGYTDIKINCGHRGHTEYGKDIVFSHNNKFKSREWNAIIVKTGKIDQPSGRSLYKYVEDIVDKGSDALLIPFEDEKGSKFHITRIFIATNDIITDEAKESIRKKIEGNVFFIDKNTLLNLF